MHRGWMMTMTAGLMLVGAATLRAEESDPALAALADGLYAKFETAKGVIVCVLEMEKTPLTVANFAGLAEGTKQSNKPAQPFYDGLKFHRVIPDFMIQGGCPRGNGTGDPGYKFADEFDPSLRFDRGGILAMANSGPASNGSQFFITHKDTPWLNDKHTIFGHVVQGMDVVNAIAIGDVLKKVTILRKGDKANAFASDQAAFNRLADAASARVAEAKKKQELAAKALVEQADAMVAEKWPKAVTTPSGLKYVVVKEGAGESPQRGNMVRAHYTGTLLSGKKFDSSRDRGAPIAFPVGRGQVIPGWDEAFLTMKKGEQRTLIIPPQLAYGNRDMGNGLIPANSTLIFDVELVDFSAAAPGSQGGE